MSVASMSKIIRVIKFVDTGGRELMEIFLHAPNTRISFFSAYVKKELIIRALQHFKARFEDKGNFIIFEDQEDEVLRKLVIFAGVADRMKRLGDSEFILKRLLELVNHMTPVEALFWFSRFIDAHDDSLRAMRRVAKAFCVLYGF